jgi:hypothetical protein
MLVPDAELNQASAFRETQTTFPFEGQRRYLAELLHSKPSDFKKFSRPCGGRLPTTDID